MSKNSYVVRLLPPQNILSKIPPLYSTEKDPDPIVWIKYFNPYGSGTWLVTEFDGHDSFFGFAKIHEGELGYFSLSELKSVKGPLGAQGIERDLHWRPKPLSQAKREEHMASNIDKGLKAIHHIACGCDAPEEPFPGLEPLAEDANFDPGHVLPNDFSEGEGSLVPSLEEKMSNYEPGEVLPNDFDEGEGSLVPSLEEKKAGMSRYCNIYKAKNGKWYMDLAPHSEGTREDAETYGPFDSLNTAKDFLEGNFSHPGIIKTDKSGKAPVPTKSPLGGKVISPNSIFASVEDIFAEDVDAKFEEGKPADPTKNLSPEDKKKWEKYHGKVEHLAQDKFAAANTITIVEEFLNRLWPQAKQVISGGDYEKAIQSVEMIQSAYFHAAGMNERVVSLQDTADGAFGISGLLKALKGDKGEIVSGKPAVEWHMEFVDKSVVPEWKKILQKYRWQAGLRSEQIISLGRDIMNYAFEELGGTRRVKDHGHLLRQGARRCPRGSGQSHCPAESAPASAPDCRRHGSPL